LAPFVLFDLDEALFHFLLPVINKYGFAYTHVNFEDYRKVCSLLEKGPCLLLCHAIEGRLPAIVESAKIPTIIIGGGVEEINHYQFPVVYFEKSELDLDLCDFFIGRMWATRIDLLQNDLREYWENIKRKSKRELKKNFESIITSENSRPANAPTTPAFRTSCTSKEFWNVLSQISNRLLNFVKVQIDSSKSLSASIEKYLENHPDLVCVYKGSFFGKFDVSSIKPSMQKNSYLFLLWKEDWPLLMICTEAQALREHSGLRPQFSIILQQELSIVADLLFKFGPGPHTPWQGIFNCIPIPMAVFSKEGEILIHNKEFTRLPMGQSELQLAMKKDLLEVGGQTIRIFKESIPFSGKEHLLMTFLTIDSLILLGHNSPRRDTVKDLGIIAGSLAHELNNPIAGILTAASVLETDSQLSDEVKEELQEIKKCASRCKELIHIFLGLSRVNLHSEQARKMNQDVHHVLE
ncbi:MAG: histidine kinase dimerization/phospho-acceptor domain-containing protein, partial [Bdellovibrionota bacterium]